MAKKKTKPADWLTRLPNSGAVALAQELRPEFLRSPTEFDIEALVAREWLAIPQPDGATDHRAVWLETAANQLGEVDGECVTAEPEVHLEAFGVPLREAEIEAFHYNCMLRVFILVPRGRTFALLDEADYLHVIAGPEDFVRTAVGGSIARGVTTFDEYANSESRPRRTREWLRSVADYYRKTHGIGG